MVEWLLTQPPSSVWKFGGDVPGSKGDTYIPEGYKFEEVGPKVMKNKGQEETRAWEEKIRAERPAGCPFAFARWCSNERTTLPVSVDGLYDLIKGWSSCYLGNWPRVGRGCFNSPTKLRDWWQQWMNKPIPISIIQTKFRHLQIRSRRERPRWCESWLTHEIWLARLNLRKQTPMDSVSQARHLSTPCELKIQSIPWAYDSHHPFLPALKRSKPNWTFGILCGDLEHYSFSRLN